MRQCGNARGRPSLDEGGAVSVYLIDGYNLMHQMLGTHLPDNAAEEAAEPVLIPYLEDERRRLIDRIASFMGGTSDRAIVVFDSRTQALQKSESATANVEVYFGSFFQSADAIIEREVYALHAGQSVVVVSSDYGLQKVIFRPNVVRRSSRQFVTDLQEHTKKIANRANCITMGNRIEDRIAPGTLDKLKALREGTEEPPEKPAEPRRSG
jgi:predicted RNA-binding protein with PIN domain